MSTTPNQSNPAVDSNYRWEVEPQECDTSALGHSGNQNNAQRYTNFRVQMEDCACPDCDLFVTPLDRSAYCDFCFPREDGTCYTHDVREMCDCGAESILGSNACYNCTTSRMSMAISQPDLIGVESYLASKRAGTLSTWFILHKYLIGDYRSYSEVVAEMDDLSMQCTLFDDLLDDENDVVREREISDLMDDDDDIFVGSLLVDDDDPTGGSGKVCEHSIVCDGLHDDDLDDAIRECMDVCEPSIVCDELHDADTESNSNYNTFTIEDTPENRESHRLILQAYEREQRGELEPLNMDLFDLKLLIRCLESESLADITSVLKERLESRVTEIPVEEVKELLREGFETIGEENIPFREQDAIKEMMGFFGSNGPATPADVYYCPKCDKVVDSEELAVEVVLDAFPCPTCSTDLTKVTTCDLEEPRRSRLRELCTGTARAVSDKAIESGQRVKLTADHVAQTVSDKITEMWTSLKTMIVGYLTAGADKVTGFIANRISEQMRERLDFLSKSVLGISKRALETALFICLIGFFVGVGAKFLNVTASMICGLLGYLGELGFGFMATCASAFKSVTRHTTSVSQPSMTPEEFEVYCQSDAMREAGSEGPIVNMVSAFIMVMSPAAFGGYDSANIIKALCVSRGLLGGVSLGKNAFEGFLEKLPAGIQAYCVASFGIIPGDMHVQTKADIVATVNLLKRLQEEPTYATTMEGAQSIQHLHQKLVEYATCYVMRAESAETARLIRTLMKDVEKFASVARTVLSEGGKRAETFGVHLYGAPGIGKTYLCALLECLLANDLPAGKRCWYWDPAKKFMNGYNGQAVVFRDEFGATRIGTAEAEANAVTLQMISNCRLNCNMADVAQKETCWTSKALIQLGNAPLTVDIAGIQHPDAYRRRMENVEASIKPAYRNADGTLNVEKLERDFTDDELLWQPHLEFQRFVFKDLKKPTSYTAVGEKFNAANLVAWIASNIKKKDLAFQKMMANSRRLEKVVQEEGLTSLMSERTRKRFERTARYRVKQPLAERLDEEDDAQRESGRGRKIYFKPGAFDTAPNSGKGKKPTGAWAKPLKNNKTAAEPAKAGEVVADVTDDIAYSGLMSSVQGVKEEVMMREHLVLYSKLSEEDLEPVTGTITPDAAYKYLSDHGAMPTKSEETWSDLAGQVPEDMRRGVDYLVDLNKRVVDGLSDRWSKVTDYIKFKSTEGNEYYKLAVKLAGGMAAGGLLYLLVRSFYHAPKNDGLPEQKSNPAKPAAQMWARPKRVTVRRGQRGDERENGMPAGTKMSPVENFDYGLQSKICGAHGSIDVQRGGPIGRVAFTAVRDFKVITVRHIFYDVQGELLDDGTPMMVTYNKQTYDIPFYAEAMVSTSVQSNTHEDLVMYDFGFNPNSKHSLVVLPRFKDFTKFFLEEEELKTFKPVEGYMAHDYGLSPVGLIGTSDCKHCYTPVDGHGKRDILMLDLVTYDWTATREGDCGSSIVLPSGGRARVIVGMHIGKKKSLGKAVGVIVTREKIEQLLSAYDDDLVIIEDCPYELTSAETSRYVPEGRKPVGRLSPRFSAPPPDKVSIEKSPLGHLDFTQIAYEPCILGNKQEKSQGHNYYDLIVKRKCKYKMRILPELNQQVVRTANQLVIDLVLSQRKKWPVREFTWSECLNRVETFPNKNEYPRNTSMGPTFGEWKGSGKYPVLIFDENTQLWDFVPEYLKVLEELHRKVLTTNIFVVAEAVLKPEVLPIEKVLKNDTRVVGVPEFAFNVLLAKSFGSFIHYCHSHHNSIPLVCGMDVESDDWDTMLARLFTKSSHGFGGDFKGFEYTHCPQTWDIYRMLTDSYYRDEGSDTQRRRHRLLEICQTLNVKVGSVLHEILSELLSGLFITESLSSVSSLYKVSSAVAAVVYETDRRNCTAAYISRIVAFAIVGDDHIVAVNRKHEKLINGENVRKYLEGRGIGYTPPEKDQDFSENQPLQNVMFLSGRSVPPPAGDPIHTVKWRYALKESSIKKQLMWMKKGTDFTMNCNSALRASWSRGPKYFNALRDNIIEGLREAHIAHETLISYGDEISRREHGLPDDPLGDAVCESVTTQTFSRVRNLKYYGSADFMRLYASAAVILAQNAVPTKVCFKNVMMSHPVGLNNEHIAAYKRVQALQACAHSYDVNRWLANAGIQTPGATLACREPNGDTVLMEDGNNRTMALRLAMNLKELKEEDHYWTLNLATGGKSVQLAWDARVQGSRCYFCSCTDCNCHLLTGSDAVTEGALVSTAKNVVDVVDKTVDVANTVINGNSADKPNVSSQVSTFRGAYNDFSNSVGVESVPVASLYTHKARPPVVGMSPEVNEMSFAYLTQKMTFLNTYHVNNTTPTGTEIFSLFNTPAQLTPTLREFEAVVPSLLEYCSLPFTWWSGDIVYMIEFIGTAYHKARFKAVTHLGAATTKTTGVEVGQQYSVTYDYSYENPVMTVVVPWRSAVPKLRVPSGSYSDVQTYATGTFSLLTNTSIVSNDAVSPAMSINVYVAGGKNFKLEGLYGNNCDYSVATNYGMNPKQNIVVGEDREEEKDETCDVVREMLSTEGKGVKFIDQTVPQQVEPHQGMTTPQNTMDDSEFMYVDAMTRATQITTFDWNITQSPNQILWSGVVPWDLLKANAAVAAQSFIKMQSAVKVRIMVNSSPFQSGMLIVSFLPLRSSNEALTEHVSSFVNMTVCPHTKIYAGKNSVVEFMIPYIHVKEMIETRRNENELPMGTLVVSVFNPLRTGDTQTTGTSVSLSLFAEFVNPKLRLLRPVYDAHIDPPIGEDAIREMLESDAPPTKLDDVGGVTETVMATEQQNTSPVASMQEVTTSVADVLKRYGPFDDIVVGNSSSQSWDLLSAALGASSDVPGCTTWFMSLYTLVHTAWRVRFITDKDAYCAVTYGNYDAPAAIEGNAATGMVPITATNASVQWMGFQVPYLSRYNWLLIPRTAAEMGKEVSTQGNVHVINPAGEGSNVHVKGFISTGDDPKCVYVSRVPRIVVSGTNNSHDDQVSVLPEFIQFYHQAGAAVYALPQTELLSSDRRITAVGQLGSPIDRISVPTDLIPLLILSALGYSIIPGQPRQFLTGQTDSHPFDFVAADVIGEAYQTIFVPGTIGAGDYNDGILVPSSIYNLRTSEEPWNALYEISPQWSLDPSSWEIAEFKVARGLRADTTVALLNNVTTTQKLSYKAPVTIDGLSFGKLGIGGTPPSNYAFRLTPTV